MPIQDTFQNPLLGRCRVLQYVDDILLAGPTEQEVGHLSEDFVTWLGSKGFTVRQVAAMSPKSCVSRRGDQDYML